LEETAREQRKEEELSASTAIKFRSLKALSVICQPGLEEPYT